MAKINPLNEKLKVGIKRLPYSAIKKNHENNYPI